MRHLAGILLTLSSSLWLGLLVAVYLFAPAIFGAFPGDRTTAGKATSAMFVRFAQVQLLLAALALVGAFLAYVQRKRPAHVALFALFAVACVGAVAYKMLLVPRMEELRLSGQSASQEFRTYHGLVMGVSTGIGLLVLAATVLTAYVQRELLTRHEPAPVAE